MVTAHDLELDNKYYDDSEFTGLEDIPVVLPNPNRDERREIRLFKSIYKGTMFVTGGARQGKDLFVYTLLYLMKRYFGRRVLLDVRPKRLFGEYVYFNPAVMMAEINKMAHLSGVEGMDKPLDEKQGRIFTEAALEWVDKNTVLFQNAVVYFSELRRYCYKRNPSNRINKFIGALLTQWGHLDMLAVGAHMQENEIDRYTYLDKTKFWVVCRWMQTRSDTTQAQIVRDMVLGNSGVYNMSPNEQVNYYVDGGAPREYLTNAKTVFKITKFGTKIAKENILLAYLQKIGAISAEQIARDMGAGIDETLKALFTLAQMGYIVGNNRFFDLFHSKNLVNLVPTLGGKV